MWCRRSVATHLVSQHGEKTCGRTPRVVLSTCSTEIQQSSLSSFCWAILVGCKCGEGCLDKIVTAQKGVLGINVGHIREASLDVPVSRVQEIHPLSADDHLCHCWKASTCSERTSEQVSQHYNQRLGTRSGNIASFKCCCTSAASARRREGLTGDNSRVGRSCLAIQLARTRQSPRVGTQSRFSVSGSALE